MGKLVTDILVVTMLLVHPVALGSMFLRASQWILRDAITGVAVVLGVGFALFGAEVFLLGEAHLLIRPAICISTAIMVGIMWWSRPWELQCIPLTSPHVSSLTSAQITLTGSLLALVFMAVLAVCPRPPATEDEIGYHWPAAQLWAANGGWVKSPYRLTNGPALAEMMFTVPALYDSPTSAHILGVIFLALTAASCASLASAVGAPPLPAAIAMLSVPALIVCVPVAHNDNIAAAFALCAYAALLNGSTDPPAVSSIIAAALTLAAAVSTKPFTILAVPGVCIYIMYAACRIGNGRQELFRGAARSAAVAITIVLTLLLWAAHCHSHSGRIWDTSGYEMAASPADPLWDSPKAAGRKARPTDYIITPLVFPIEMTIGHERGFSGNRIGPLLLVFFPLGIWGIRSLKREERTTLCFLIGSAAFYLLMFSPTAPKTRFHLFVWGIGAVVAAIGLQWTQLRRPCIARLCFAGFLLLASAGLLDACRHLYSFGHYLTQRSS